MTDAAPAWLACPRCPEGALRPIAGNTDLAECSHCAHRALSAHASEALALDTYLAQAIRRRTWLMDQITAGTVTPQTSDVARAPLAQAGGSARATLFATGGVLLGLAALVFLSFAWAVLPLAGRVALVVALATALMAAGRALTATMRGAAETFTALGVTLAVLAAWATPDLFGAAWSAREHATWATGLFTLAMVATAARTRTSVLSTWRVAYASAAAVAATGATVAAATYGHAWLVTLVAAGGGAALLNAPVALERWGPVRTVNALHLNGASGALLRVSGRLLVGVVASGSVVVGVATNEVWASAATVLVVAAVPALSSYLTPGSAGRRTAECSFAAGETIALSLVLWQVCPHWTPALLAVLAALALSVVARSPRVAAPFASAAATASALAAGIAVTVAVATATTLTLTLTILGAATFAAALAGRSKSLNSGYLAAIGAATGTCAWWSWLSARDTLDGFPPEAWTGPPALLLLLTGLIVAVRTHRDTGAWPSTVRTYLPFLLVAGLPGALVGSTESLLGDGSVRASLYLLAGASVAAAGGRARLGAPVYAGVSVAATAAAGHLITASLALPGWTVLAAAGLVILVAAIRWEWLAQRSRSWASVLR